MLLLVVVSDQISKYVIRQLYELGDQSVIFPNFFRIVYLQNTGAAWGIAAGNSIILAALSVVIILIIIWKFDYLTERVALRRFALGLILGGTVGNLVDRIFLGGVVDFIYLHYQDHFSWPAFNVADAAITVGVVVFLCSVFFGGTNGGYEQHPEDAGQSGRE